MSWKRGERKEMVGKERQMRGEGERRGKGNENDNIGNLNIGI